MLPVELFSKDIYISNGLKSQCKSCDNKRKSLSRKQQKKYTSRENKRKKTAWKRKPGNEIKYT